MQKTKLSQSGFTALHTLLFLVIIGIIGFAGWKVYDAGKFSETTDSSASTTPVTKKAEPKKKVSTIPVGFVEYANKDLGFKLAYPKQWGDVTVEDTRFLKKPEGGSSADKGKRWMLKFSNLKTSTIGLTSKDWSTEAGRGGLCTVADGSDYRTLPNPQPTNANNISLKILDKSERYFLTENAEYGYCNGLSLAIEYIFSDSPEYLTLKVLDYVYELKNEAEFNDYSANPSKYVQPERIETLKLVAKSIQDL